MADPEDQVNPDENAETTRREATRDPTELVPVYENARAERETSLEPPSDAGITVDPATLNGQFTSTVEGEALPPIEAQADETTTTAPVEENTETASADNEETATAETDVAGTEGVDTAAYEVPFTPAGYTTDPTPGKKHGRKMHTNIPQQSMGDAFGQLIYLLSLLLNDPEMFPFAVDQLYPKDVYIDPADRERTTEDRNRRIEALREVVEDPDHPDRQLPPEEFIERHFGSENLNNLKPHIRDLMTQVIEGESRGSLDVLYDYRNKLRDPGEPYAGHDYFKGYHTGDVVFSEYDYIDNLTVPDPATTSINDLIEWQKKYITAQYQIVDANGKQLIPNKTGSSAFGVGQFTYTRLEQLVELGYVDGTRNFDLAGQTSAITGSIQQLVDHAIEESDGTTQGISNLLRENLTREWEILQKGFYGAQLTAAIDGIVRDSDRSNIYVAATTPNLTR